MPEPLPRLTAAEAAARLGVKPATLYAYVSRGLLSRHRTAGGSRFDPLEIEGFARTRSRAAAPGLGPSAAPGGGARGDARAPGSPLMVLDTDIAVVEDDELYFRGHPVAELVDIPVEQLASWLWAERGRLPDDAVAPVSALPAFGAATFQALHIDPDAVNSARRLVAALPEDAALIDRVHAAVIGLATADPLRYDTSAENLMRTGAVMLAGIPRAIAPAGVAAPPDSTIACALWPALVDRGRAPQAPSRPTAHDFRALNAALVLLIDHDLAVSTLAARVAASARGSGYAIVTAALGAFDSPLHGNASRAATDLLSRVVAGAEPAAALAHVMRAGTRGVPGFGHGLYVGTDARARALLPLISELPGAQPVIGAVEAVSDEVTRRAGIRPNVDLALAALTLAAGLRPDAGAAIFAIGRLIGWIAHAAAEYEERPMRLRPRGRYVGP